MVKPFALTSATGLCCWLQRSRLRGYFALLQSSPFVKGVNWTFSACRGVGLWIGTNGGRCGALFARDATGFGAPTTVSGRGLAAVEAVSAAGAAGALSASPTRTSLAC